ncbi:Ankyrin repeat protein [Pandoravirus kuranda]|uniref:Ankyrin repeat protein n=1 Tax=Pandoravirus kuranda TaxID=3019033 RepID=A0AA95EDF5_9VIRU|nr:Ankyrin repeat protein [Pandoravirus kuranda]
MSGGTDAGGGARFDHLPSELVHAILGVVDSFDLVVCARVSRLWRAAVLHLRNARRSVDDDSIPSKRRQQDFLWHAAHAGYHNLVEWACAEGCPWDVHAPTAALQGGHAALFCRLVDSGRPWNVRDCLSAAGVRGDVDAVRWIIARSDPIDEAYEVMADVAGAGHLDALALIADHCHKFCNEVCSWFTLSEVETIAAIGRVPPCPCTDDVVRRAAGGGHTHILAWLHDRGYMGRSCSIVAAAHGGHTEVLEWFAAEGHAFDKAIYTTAAADGGQLAALKWLRAAGCPWDDRVCLYSAARGHLCVLGWAIERGCPWHAEATATAAAHGHLDVAEWCLARGCAVTNVIVSRWPDLYDDQDADGADDTPRAEALCVAARLGRIDVLVWLRDHGCTGSNPWAFADAAESGCVAVLDWLHAHCQPWDAEACAYVAGCGQLAALKHMRAGGCPWDGRVYVEAATWNHPDVLVWAHANGCPWSTDAMHQVAECARVAPNPTVLRWIVERGCPWSAAMASSVACRYDDPEFFAWVVDKGLAWDPHACAAAASRYGRLRTAEWIAAHIGNNMRS